MNSKSAQSQTTVRIDHEKIAIDRADKLASLPIASIEMSAIEGNIAYGLEAQAMMIEQLLTNAEPATQPAAQFFVLRFPQPKLRSTTEIVEISNPMSAIIT